MGQGEEPRTKSIEMCRMKVGDIKTDFGNPRKIRKPKMEELKESYQRLGDFGIFLIDEENNVIAGNQRLKVALELYGPGYEVECKRLIGYTKQELREINVKDNTHSGTWDLDLLADWSVSGPSFDGIIDAATKDAEDRRIREMELLPFEKYDYVLVVCRSPLDYDELIDKLGIRGKVCKITNKRTIRARAIWYNEFRNKLWGLENGDADTTQGGDAEAGADGPAQEETEEVGQ